MLRPRSRPWGRSTAAETRPTTGAAWEGHLSGACAAHHASCCSCNSLYPLYCAGTATTSACSKRRPRPAPASCSGERFCHDLKLSPSHSLSALLASPPPSLHRHRRPAGTTGRARALAPAPTRMVPPTRWLRPCTPPCTAAARCWRGRSMVSKGGGVSGGAGCVARGRGRGAEGTQRTSGMRCGRTPCWSRPAWRRRPLLQS